MPDQYRKGLIRYCMNILYLHGLDGSLSDDKRSALEGYGAVIGPEINYRATPNTIIEIQDKYQSDNIDVVIGNSMGGLAAYYISLKYDTPCLIFNPALPYTSVSQTIPGNLHQRNQFLQVVLGRQDDVIKLHDNLRFLEQNINAETDASVHIINKAGHRIPIEIFEAELKSFFDTLAAKPIQEC